MPLRFADVSIPAMTALALSARIDKTTAADERYVIKTAIAASFGFDAVRPWRLLSKTDGVYRVLGVLRDGADVKPNAQSRSLGIVVDVVEYDVPETLDLSVQATPVKRVSFNKPGTRERLRSVFMDVAARKDLETGTFRKPGPDELRLAYMQWLVETLSEEGRTGMRVIDEPHVLSTRPLGLCRKRRGETGTVWTSCVDAKVRVMVRDREAFEGFVKLGLKKMKDLGLGAMIPSDVIDGLPA